jgi:hypothetical protein
MANDYLGAERRHLPRTVQSEIGFRRYRSNTYVRSTQVIAGTVVTILVPAQPNRVTMLLINNSQSDVYVNFTPDVNSEYAMPLTANGGQLSMTIEDEGEGVSTELFGVASVDNLKLTLVETLLQEVS